MESILHSINDLLINTWEEGLTRTTCSRLQILFFPNWLSTSHYGAENVKMFRPKNLWNQIKSISRKNFFLTKFLLICNFTNGQKSIFELGKSLKLPKMQFRDFFNTIYLISRVFLLGIFLIFLTHCEMPGKDLLKI